MSAISCLLELLSCFQEFIVLSRRRRLLLPRWILTSLTVLQCCWIVKSTAQYFWLCKWGIWLAHIGRMALLNLHRLLMRHHRVKFIARRVLPLNEQVLIARCLCFVAWLSLDRFKPICMLERHVVAVHLLLHLLLLLLLHFVILVLVHQLFTLLYHASIVWPYYASAADADSNFLE